ncbi:hypothetical protein [Streptomyces venetus]|uniref:hypothetical protein n=1 Tax=Streptomyces venetus TaxID=1701086 RepID=UPI003C2E98C7
MVDSDSTIWCNLGRPPLTLFDDLRLAPVGGVPAAPAPRRADIGQHGLGRHAVAAAAAVLLGRLLFVMAEVVGDLILQADSSTHFRPTSIAINCSSLAIQPAPQRARRTRTQGTPRGR